jgi:hypothetical protein
MANAKDNMPLLLAINTINTIKNNKTTILSGVLEIIPSLNKTKMKAQHKYIAK